jgi:hypothetical protein
MASTWLSEYRVIVDFALFLAGLLRADDADAVPSTPRENDTIDLKSNSAKGNPPFLAIVFAIVDAFEPFISKRSGSREERNAVLFQVKLRLDLVPLKLEFWVCQT